MSIKGRIAKVESELGANEKPEVIFFTDYLEKKDGGSEFLSSFAYANWPGGRFENFKAQQGETLEAFKARVHKSLNLVPDAKLGDDD